MNRLAILLLSLLPLALPAKVRLPAIFSDHLVLQQNYGNPIWGWAQPGEKVTVSTSWGEEHSLTTGENGKWMARSKNSKRRSRGPWGPGGKTNVCCGCGMCAGPEGGKEKTA